MRYKVYQQGTPEGRNGVFYANIKLIDWVEAEDADSAIKKAKTMLVFRMADGGGRFPIVEAVQVNPKGRMQ